jgi:hypothetical protein
MKGVAIMRTSTDHDNGQMSPFMVAMLGRFLPDLPDNEPEDIDWEGLM